jgi:hypothetical protein
MMEVLITICMGGFFAAFPVWLVLEMDREPAKKDSPKIAKYNQHTVTEYEQRKAEAEAREHQRRIEYMQRNKKG